MEKYVIDLDKILDEFELNDQNEFNPNNSKDSLNGDYYHPQTSSASSSTVILKSINLNNNDNDKINMDDADFSIHLEPPKFYWNPQSTTATELVTTTTTTELISPNEQLIELIKHDPIPESLSLTDNLIGDDKIIEEKNTNKATAKTFGSNQNLNQIDTITMETDNNNDKNIDVSSFNNDDSDVNISNQINCQEKQIDTNNKESNCDCESKTESSSTIQDTNQAIQQSLSHCDNVHILDSNSNFELESNQLIESQSAEFVKDEEKKSSLLNDKTEGEIETSNGESSKPLDSQNVQQNQSELSIDPSSEPVLNEQVIDTMPEEELDQYLSDLHQDLKSDPEDQEDSEGNSPKTQTKIACKVEDKDGKDVDDQKQEEDEDDSTPEDIERMLEKIQEEEDDEELKDTISKLVNDSNPQSNTTSNENIEDPNHQPSSNEMNQGEQQDSGLNTSNTSNISNETSHSSETRGGLVQNITYFERQEMPNGLTEEEQMLGKIKPFWIPDEDAQNCLHCDVKFTLIKRRHHCRSCGKVLCSQCCNFKAKLPYLEYKEARVCQLCYAILIKIEEIERINGHRLEIPQQSSSNSTNDNTTNVNSMSDHIPDPNNPSEYCSTIPISEQVSPDQAQLPPPTVMVPVGVLKRPGSSNLRNRNNSPESSDNSNTVHSPKQVMFSDGVRPGGDLVEPPGSSTSKNILPSDEQKPMTRTQLQLKSPLAEKILTPLENFSKRIKLSRVVVPDNNGQNLPPIINFNEFRQVDPSLPSKPSYLQLIDCLKNPQMPCITFGLTKNLHIITKIVSKTCCKNKECWVFVSKGLASAGQDEILFVLDCDSLRLPMNAAAVPTDVNSDDTSKDNANQPIDDTNNSSSQQQTNAGKQIYIFPRDILRTYTTIYDSASKAQLYSDLSHIFIPDGLFQNKENSGFLFTRPAMQCFQNIPYLPSPPFLIAILIHKWEIPWAKVFPLRLILRLGYEYKSYPSPVISYANRKSAYFEIGHTIMNVLADFRNFHYTLSVVKDLFICMEEKKRVSLLINKLSYEKVCKVLSTSNEHVLAFGGNLSLKADSHLVCVQNEDDDDIHSQYHTQLFSMPGSPEKYTAASFIVFSGALKSTTGLKAKMNIVEDGLLVQIPPTLMEELRSAIKDMKDFKIDCCKINETNSCDEWIQLKWVNDELSTNLGVRSQIDGLNLEGALSARIFSNPDYANERYLIRWIEVFLLQIDDHSRRSEMINANRLAESAAQAFCLALIDFLDQLYESGLTKISLRINLDVDKVGYETGSGGKPLPTQITQPLDSALIPVIMENISTTGIDEPLVIELLFFVLLK